MKSSEVIYTTSLKGYQKSALSSDHPSIIVAKERNKRLTSIRCNEIYRGESYFKNKKDQELYRSTCHSLPSRAIGKSLMFKSDLTNVTSIDENRPATTLNDLNAKINTQRNREQLQTSYHSANQASGQARKLSDLIQSNKKDLHEYEEEIFPEDSDKLYQKTNPFYSPKAGSRQPQQYYYFSDEKPRVSEFKEIIEDIEGENLLNQSSQFYPMQKVQNQNPKNLKIPQTRNQFSQINSNSILFSHAQRSTYLPNRNKKTSTSKQKNQEQQIQILRNLLKAKEEEVKQYKNYLELSRKKEQELLQQLDEMKEIEISKDLQMTKNKFNCQNRNSQFSSEFSNSKQALIYFTFMMILLVKMGNV